MKTYQIQNNQGGVDQLILNESLKNSKIIQDQLDEEQKLWIRDYINITRINPMASRKSFEKIKHWSIGYETIWQISVRMDNVGRFLAFLCEIINN